MPAPYGTWQQAAQTTTNYQQAAQQNPYKTAFLNENYWLILRQNVRRKGNY